MNLVKLLGLVGLSAMVSALGCSVIDPSLIATDDASVPDTATPDADETDTETPVDAPAKMDGCDDDGSARPPARPAIDDGDGPEVIFGLKEVLLVQRGETWKDIGFNLDDLCSQPPAPLVECLPPAFPDAVEAVDGNRGVDNQFGSELTPLVDLVFPTLSEAAVNSAEEGVGVVVFRIRGWNGEANDPRVDVTVTQSVAGAADQDGSPPEIEVRDFRIFEPGTENRYTPSWDGSGTDWFWVREETFLFDDLEQPRVRDDNAYIADNQLVVTLPDRVEIVFADTFNGISVKLTDGLAVGTTSEDGTRLSPTVFGGRWSVLDLLDTASSVGVCEGDPEFDLVVNQLNNIADVRSVPGSGGPGVSCDAISVGVTFEGYRVQIAGMLPGQQPPNECDE